MPAWIVPAALLLLALGLRLYRLTYQGLWFDEANGVLFAREPLARILELLRDDSSPPLYYFLLHFWMLLCGGGEAAVRLLSVAGGALLVLAVLSWGRRLFSPAAGALAAFYVAIAPIQIFHSQQARMYSLLPLLALMSLGHFCLYLQGERRRHLVFAALFAVLALYTHNFAFHLVPVYVILFLAAGRRGALLPCLAAAAAAALAYLPWLPGFLAQLRLPEQYSWLRPIAGSWSLFHPILVTFRSFSPGGEGTMFCGHDAGLWGGWPALACTALAAAGLVRLWRRRAAGGRAAALLLPVYLLAPLASALAASRLPGIPPHYVPGRVDQMFFPAFALLVAQGLVALPRLWLRGLAAAGMLAVCLGTLPRFALDPADLGFQGHEREAAAAIAARYRAQDVLLCTSWSARPIHYYLQRRGVEPGIVEYMGFLPELETLGEKEREDFLAYWIWKVEKELRQRLGPGGRVFLVALGGTENSALALGRLLRAVGLRVDEKVGAYLLGGMGREILLLQCRVEE